MIVLCIITATLLQENSVGVDVFYISLPHRTDRQQQIESDLNRMNVDYKMIKAVKGTDDMIQNKCKQTGNIEKQKSTIGCALSHIKTLETSTKNVLVLEDDVKFRYWPNIDELLLHDWWDVIPFSYNGRYNRRNCKRLERKRYCKTDGVQTTSAYLVKDYYKSKLIKSFNNSLELLKQNIDPEIAAIDQQWKNLAKTDNWYIPVPRVSFQRKSYSDIERAVVNYKV